jgi:hypothetical protein
MPRDKNDKADLAVGDFDRLARGHFRINADAYSAHFVSASGSMALAGQPSRWTGMSFTLLLSLQKILDSRVLCK